MALLALLLLSLASSLVSARDIYISYTNGHDSNSGSAGSPLQSIQAGVVLIRNDHVNNTIYLMCDGDHIVNATLQVDVMDGNLTITSAPSCSSRAIVTGAMPVSAAVVFKTPPILGCS